VAEGAPLLREYTSKGYRGFESHPLRHPALITHNQLILNDNIRRGICPVPPRHTPKNTCAKLTDGCLVGESLTAALDKAGGIVLTLIALGVLFKVGVAIKHVQHGHGLLNEVLQPLALERL
jgi:hypothetical protein